MSYLASYSHSSQLSYIRVPTTYAPWLHAPLFATQIVGTSLLLGLFDKWTEPGVGPVPVLGEGGE